MSRYFLIADVKELEYSGEKLGIFSVLFPGGRRLEYTAKEIEQYCFTPEQLVRSISPPELTMDQKIAAARASLTESVVLLPERRVVEEVAVEDKGIKVLAELGLQANIRNNEEAGPDGSMFSTAQAQAYASQFTDGNGRDKIAIVRKLASTPLRHLMAMAGLLPKPLRHAVAMQYCSSLGSGPQGQAGNYIPANWADFVEGSDQSAAMLAAMGEDVKQYTVVESDALRQMTFAPPSSDDVAGGVSDRLAAAKVERKP